MALNNNKPKVLQWVVSHRRPWCNLLGGSKLELQWPFTVATSRSSLVYTWYNVKSQQIR